MTAKIDSTNLSALGGRPPRAIGPGGTIVRAVLGCTLLGLIVRGELTGPHRTGLGLAVGLIGFPAVMLAWQWLRARSRPAPVRATGLLPTAVNCLVGLGIYLTGILVPPLWFASDALLAFYGLTLLVAAVRGYAGCEVLAISNWVLGRDDQIGCVVLSLVDGCEGSLRPGRPNSHAGS